jgi:hypothetical protein
VIRKIPAALRWRIWVVFRWSGSRLFIRGPSRSRGNSSAVFQRPRDWRLGRCHSSPNHASRRG